MQMLYDAALEVCNGIRNSYGDLKILLQLTDTLKKNEWYVNVPDIQKVALDQAIEVAQTIVDKGEYDANLQQVKTTLEDAYHVALKSSIQQLVSQVKSYTETDIANIYSYLDGKKVVDEVIARVMAELDTDNYSSMLQIADSLQALFSNVKIEAEKYGAELQNAKQNANQLLTDVYTLQNETYKDIYPYLDVDIRKVYDEAVNMMQQMVKGYDKMRLCRLQIACRWYTIMSKSRQKSMVQIWKVLSRMPISLSPMHIRCRMKPIRTFMPTWMQTIVMRLMLQ